MIKGQLNTEELHQNLSTSFKTGNKEANLPNQIRIKPLQQPSSASNMLKVVVHLQK